MTNYIRLGTMVLVSTVAMYGLMYLNAFNADHIWFNQTRAWMAVIMCAVMAALMIASNHGWGNALESGSLQSPYCGGIRCKSQGTKSKPEILAPDAWSWLKQMPFAQ